MPHVTTIKKRIRERDNYTCQKCGNDGPWVRLPDVHRLIPGSYYRPHLCVTLCNKCHSKMPRTIDDVFRMEPEDAGVAVTFLNLFLLDEREAFEALKKHCGGSGRKMRRFVYLALRDRLQRKGAMPKPTASSK